MIRSHSQAGPRRHAMLARGPIRLVLPILLALAGTFACARFPASPDASLNVILLPKGLARIGDQSFPISRVARRLRRIGARPDTPIVIHETSRLSRRDTQALWQQLIGAGFRRVVFAGERRSSATISP